MKTLISYDIKDRAFINIREKKSISNATFRALMEKYVSTKLVVLLILFDTKDRTFINIGERQKPSEASFYALTKDQNFAVVTWERKGQQQISDARRRRRVVYLS